MNSQMSGEALNLQSNISAIKAIWWGNIVFFLIECKEVMKTAWKWIKDIEKHVQADKLNHVMHPHSEAHVYKWWKLQNKI